MNWGGGGGRKSISLGAGVGGVIYFIRHIVWVRVGGGRGQNSSISLHFYPKILLPSNFRIFSFNSKLKDI